MSEPRADAARDKSAGLPSLRKVLLRHVLRPLLATWVVCSMLVIGISNYFVGRAFDRSILDDAYSVASHVGVRDGRLALLLSPDEMATLLFDQTEQVMFAVFGSDGKFIAGHPGLQLRQRGVALNAQPAFGDDVLMGKSVRTATIFRSEPQVFAVVLAQTVAERTQLVTHLLHGVVMPQVLLLLILAWWLRAAITRDLQPLVNLQQRLRQRDVNDLSALSLRASTSDIQALANSVDALLSRIDQGVRSQREFAGTVAHELRTPLAGIRALANYGLAQQQPSVWREQLHAIERSEERASHLVDQLLALALAAEQGRGLRLVNLNLSELTREVVLRTLHRADSVGADLGAKGLDVVHTVCGNPGLIEGILNNLLDNAFRYGRPIDGSPMLITVELESGADGSTVLSVSDSGAGMDGELSAAWFSRWNQGYLGKKLSAGSGLGLGIVTEYAKMMDAEVQLKPNASGPGLRVEVTFWPPALLVG